MAVVAAYVGFQVVKGISGLVSGRKRRRALRAARKLQRANTIEQYLQNRRQFQRAGRAAIADAAIGAAASGEGALQGSVFQATQASLQTQLGSRLGTYDDIERRNRKIEQLGVKADRAAQQHQSVANVADTATDVLGLFVNA